MLLLTHRKGVLTMEKNIQPKVSVIIPCYNVEAYLAECLDSVINQTLKEIEIVCINDGSKDSTLEILQRYAEKDERIVLISQENSGLSKTRNRGVELAKGEFITFLDSDDWVDLDFLEKLYNAASKNSCDIACATVIRKRPKAQKYRFHYIEEKVYKTLEEKINICRVPECCYACGKLFKTDFIKDKPFKVGVYFEDVLWIPEVLKQSNAIVTIPESAYWYRVNPNSITKKATPAKQNDSYKAKKYIVEFFKENNIELPKKNQYPTKEVKYLFNIPIIRVKDYGEVDKYLLFDILPIKTRKNS